MRIPVDRKKPQPLYQQIQNYLREQITSGQLQAGTRLPATRKLALDLGVSRITVQNAYADLESEGLIGSREGSGSYVLRPVQGVMNMAQEHLAAAESQITWPLWQQDLRPDPAALAELTPQPEHPDMISFTGVGASDQFPVKDFARALRTVLNQDGVSALDYGDFGGGFPPLRQTIAHVLASQGIQAHPENLLITSGSQQALALVCQILLKPSDVVITEEPTYNLALDLFRSLHLKVVGVPMDGSGMQVELLEPLLQQHHPRLLYTIPNFQNPSGRCLSGRRRRSLVQLADRYNLPILEDDFAGDLRYEGRAQPAIKALDPGGRVIYAGTFSKMLMPGLRVGYLAAEGPLFARLVQSKQVADLATSNLLQHALQEYVTVGRYQVHIRRSTRLYRARRDAMLGAIRQHLPDAVRVAHPQGGLFIWLELPDSIRQNGVGVSADQLLPVALTAGVEFAPGSRFYPDPDRGANFLRLNFAVQPPERIEEGIRRLGDVIRRLG